MGYHSNMNKDLIQSNITKVLEQVSTSAEKYGRSKEEILLLAVSKTQPLEAVKAAYACGLRDFGENYLQEALEKIEGSEGLDIRWHFIGPLQANKTRQVARHFDWVHSIDRSKLLLRLNEQRPLDRGPLQVCIQVNISGEESKAGIDPAELPELLAEAAALPNLRLRGLMAIPAPATDFGAQKNACDALARLFHSHRESYPAMDTLSIGMSADMQAAIAAGSNLLRIGTAIFGPRTQLRRG